MQKVLITGGSGFIGTNLIESLRRQSYSLLNIDLAQPLNPEHLIFWKQADILDKASFEEAVNAFDPEIIIHLAAVTDLNGKDLEYYSANIKGTENLITIAANLPNLKKVIYTSSMYVCIPGFIPSDYDTYCPHTIYGESKVLGEKLVKGIIAPSYSWVIIRPTSIWGPWFREPYIDFFKIVAQKKYFNFGKACCKTYGFIENTVFQITQLMATEEIHGRTFYLGDLPATQINEWAEEISIEMGLGKIKKVPFILIKILSNLGDLLLKFNIKFPITSFRLTNMTTNNVIPLNDIYAIAGQLPSSRLEGVKKTILWMKK